MSLPLLVTTTTTLSFCPPCAKELLYEINDYSMIGRYVLDHDLEIRVLSGKSYVIQVTFAITLRFSIHPKSMQKSNILSILSLF